jgi:hypothetical protein
MNISIRILLAAMLLMVSGPITGARSQNQQIKGLQLPKGYSFSKGNGVDAALWNIKSANGLIITFEAGPTEGAWANIKKQRDYSWFREQFVRGYTVRYALIKSGIKTQWEPDNSRGLPPGQIVLITYFLSGTESADTANFCAKVANMGELADVLIIANSLDPKAAGI